MRIRAYVSLYLALLLLMMLCFAEAVNAAELTTDKKVYKLGETIELTITNNGQESVTYAVDPSEVTNDPFRWHGLKIENIKTGEVVVIYPRLLTYYKPFMPGESRTLLWDQTYSVYEDIPGQGMVPSPKNGQPVPSGKYTATVIPDLKVTFRIIKHE